MNGKTVVTVVVLVIMGVFGFQYFEAQKQERMIRLEAYQQQTQRQQEAEYRARQDAERRQREEEERRRQEEARRQEEERQRIMAAHRDKAFSLAERAKDRIINKAYDGGSNKGIEIKEWEYNPGSETYRMKVALTWNGYFYSSNRYAADGYITVGIDGSDLKWNPTWVNSTLTEYQETKHTFGAILGTVVALGAIGSSSSVN